jgi:alpha-1,6-mannosyltransferase
MPLHLPAALIFLMHCGLIYRSTLPWADAVYWLLISQLIAWICWLILTYQLRQQPLPGYWWLWSLLISLSSLTAAPLLDDDVWRFLWDGYLTCTGHSPYASTPLDHLTRSGQLPPALQSTLDRVAYPDAPTVYGPSLQAAFALAAYLAPGQIGPWKLQLILAFGLLLYALHRQLSPSQRWWLMPLSLTPTLHLEISLNAHPDILPISFIALAFSLYPQRPHSAALLAALATSARIHTWVLLPFILWLLPPRARATLILSLACIYTPFILDQSYAEWTGLLRFSQLWEYNSSLVALLGSTSSARLISLCIAALLCALAFIRWAISGAKREAIPAPYCYAVLFCCSSVFNPWYSLWLLPFLPYTHSLWPWAWLSLPALSYLTLGNLQLNLMDSFQHPDWLRPLEFTLLALATYAANHARRARSQSSHSSTSGSTGSSLQASPVDRST